MVGRQVADASSERNGLYVLEAQAVVQQEPLRVTCEPLLVSCFAIIFLGDVLRACLNIIVLAT